MSTRGDLGQWPKRSTEPMSMSEDRRRRWVSVEGRDLEDTQKMDSTVLMTTSVFSDGGQAFDGTNVVVRRSAPALGQRGRPGTQGTRLDKAHAERALGRSHRTTAAPSRGHGQGLARKGERPCGQVRDEDSDDKTRDNAWVYEKSTTKSFLVTWLCRS